MLLGREIDVEIDVRRLRKVKAKVKAKRRMIWISQNYFSIRGNA